MKCFCDSKKNYSVCCEPFLSGKKVAETPEQLMRSRYSAYAQANIDYIESTMTGAAAKNFDHQSAKTWSQSVSWLGLTVVNATDHEVEFIARFKDGDKQQCIYERSQFQKINDRWFYVSGHTPKVKRNDPCPCQSGKKAKRCCFT